MCYKRNLAWSGSVLVGVNYNALMEDGGLAQENANRTQKAAYTGWTVNDDVPSRVSLPYNVS